MGEVIVAVGFRYLFLVHWQQLHTHFDVGKGPVSRGFGLLGNLADYIHSLYGEAINGVVLIEEMGAVFVLDEVKLGTAGAFFGVDSIAHACGSQSPLHMGKGWVKLCRNGVAGVALSVVGRVVVFAVSIAALDHKSFNNPVKGGGIVVFLSSHFEEIPAVLRGFREKHQGHFTKVGFDNGQGVFVGPVAGKLHGFARAKNGGNHGE